MKELTCEMCGSNNVIKQDGLFVCQVCNTKYSKEEAKKIMFEGTVKIDYSEDLENLYELARRYKKSENFADSLKYYEMILIKDPNNLETNFNVLYFKALQDSKFFVSYKEDNSYNSVADYIKKFEKSSNALLQGMSLLFDLIKDNADINEEKFLKEVYDDFQELDNIFYNSINVSSVNMDSWDIQFNLARESKINLINIFYSFGDKLLDIFGEKYKDLAIGSWKFGISKHELLTSKLLFDIGDLDTYINKVKEYDSNYNPPIKQKIKDVEEKNGCYIATSIYGSYDCPEVWTLRRYRDYKLAKTFTGRLFIKTYYILSPIFVKYFGNTRIFKRFFKPELDKLVKKLQDEGYSSNYYCDM